MDCFGRGILSPLEYLKSSRYYNDPQPSVSTCAFAAGWKRHS